MPPVTPPTAVPPPAPATAALSALPGPAPARPEGDARAEAAAPSLFLQAVAALRATTVRPEITVAAMRAPQRLAPWTYALSADVHDAEGEELATGRLVLLHDPDGVEAWDGVLRLVAFASAEIESDIALDPLLPTVGWSWLTSSLGERGAEYTAAGGTVTQTTSTRFGDIHGPQTTVALELRASWTPVDGDLTAHLQAFADLLGTAAGLPPEGVAVLGGG